MGSSKRKNPSSPRSTFQINEATIEDIHLGFQNNEITSEELVQFYLNAIERQKDKLHAVIEVNPDALTLAKKADYERKNPGGGCCCGGMLEGIPVLVKDNIATSKDKLNTTAGSFALLGSVVPRDAEVVYRLREAGAIILGKAGLSEWAYYRDQNCPPGWSARGGTVQNPYTPGEEEEGGGSSTGSAVSVAANLVTVSLGTETSGSIVWPCSVNCVVGIKPTVGLTSRSGVIPITRRQDSVGPIGRTVSDAVYLLDVIVGSDSRDEMTKEAAKFIPAGGYKQFLNARGLESKRIGNLWDNYKENYEDEDGNVVSQVPDIFQQHIDTMRKNGAVIVNIPIADFWDIQEEMSNNIGIAFKYEFKRDLNIYLSNLLKSPIRSLADAIAFNKANPEKEKLVEYGQGWFIEAENTSLPSSEYEEAIRKLEKTSKEVFEKLMDDNNLDVVVAPQSNFFDFLGIGGYPEIIVPAGFDAKYKNMPFGILFGGLRGSEPKLIEIAYSFEQATKVRKPPT